MRFHYKAVTAQGLTVEGDGEAKDKFALAHELKGQGVTVFFAKAHSAADSSRGWQYWNERIIRITLRDKITFASNIGSMLSAGLPLARALGVILKQTRNRRFKRIVEAVVADVTTGSGLSEALGKHAEVFPDVLVAMVASGEQSGNLPGALTTVSEQLSKTDALRRKIKGAMIYPAVILCIMAAIGLLMLVYVVPTLTATFAEMGTELPASTRFIMGLSGFLASHLVGILVLAFGILLLLWLAVRSSWGKRIVIMVCCTFP